MPNGHQMPESEPEVRVTTLERVGRSDRAAGFTRVTTWGAAALVPPVFAIFAWFSINLLNTEREAIKAIADHQIVQDNLISVQGDRLTKIEADRNVRIEASAKLDTQLLARMDRTDENIAKLTNAVVAVTTKLDDFISAVRAKDHP